MSELLDWALKYAARGIHVFPCHYVKPDGFCSCGQRHKVTKELCRKGKHPFTFDGFKSATTDESKIRDWWADGAGWSIGAATGKISGFWVFDEDTYKPCYEDVVRKKYGEFPETAQSLTGSGGMQTFFRYDPLKPLASSSPWKDQGIDIKADLGYVILPPSASGSRAYHWEAAHHIDEMAFADAPQWFYDEIAAWLKARASTPAKPMQLDADGMIPYGRRRPVIFSLLGSMHGRKMGIDAMRAAAYEINKKCVIPLTEAELEKMLRGITRYESRDPAMDHYESTDTGNSQRFVAMHKEQVRFCPGIGWLVWDGRRFKRDDANAVVELAKELTQFMLAEASGIEDEDMRKFEEAWAKKSQDKGRIMAMIELAKSDASLLVQVEQLDANPWAFNCLNGTVNLKTGQLHEHAQSDLLTKISPWEYDETARSEEWENFLSQVMLNDAPMIAYLQRIIGYTMTPSVEEDALFILHGGGANGKSTFIDLVFDMMGDYATKLPMDSLLKKTGGSGGIPCDIAMLRGARMASASESEEGRRMSESIVKSLTSRARIAARFLHEDFFSFPPTHKLFMDTNFKPIIRGDDNGIWRRVHLIPWLLSIAREKWDLKLPDRLRSKDNAAGVLAWMVRGCLAWQRDGLAVPKAVVGATESYKAEMDTIGAYLDERVTVLSGMTVQSSELYADYRQWCEVNGEYAVSNKRFSLALEQRQFEKKHTKTGAVWFGLYLAGQFREA